MATIAKRVTSTGKVTYQANCRRTGYPVRSKRFANKSDAVPWARRIEREFDTGEATGMFDKAAHADTTIGDVLKRFRNDVLSTLRGGAVDTVRTDRWLEQKWTDTKVLEFSPSILSKFRDDRMKNVCKRHRAARTEHHQCRDEPGKERLGHTRAASEDIQA